MQLVLSILRKKDLSFELRIPFPIKITTNKNDRSGYLSISFNVQSV